MNKRLPDEILSMVQKLNPDESKAFVKYSLRKTPTDKSEHKYIKLFKLYLKQADELEFDENKLLEEARKISLSITDLNQKLHEELIKFMGVNYREKSKDTLERRISDLLDVSIALHDKRLFHLSAKNFLAAIRLLKSNQELRMKEHLLYLSLKAYTWVYELKFRSGLTETEQNEFDEFHNFFRPFATLARNSFSALSQENKLDSMVEDSFEKSTFYSLLNIYFRERLLFEDTFLEQNNNSIFGLKSLKGRYRRFGSADKAAEQIEDDLIDAETYYYQLERLHRAILANNSIEFDRAFYTIRDKLFPNFSRSEFNANLLLFVYRQLFELKVLWTVKNQEPFDTYGLRDLAKISRAKMNLFHESEIGDLPVRLELNSLAILFMEKKYEELLFKVDSLEEKIKREFYKDYFADVKLLGIICRLQLGGAADGDLDKRITYYENYTKKYTVAEFHKKLSGFIKAFINASSNDRKKVCEKYARKLEAARETFNHFHALLLHWLKNCL